jgi:hypothetical protein
MNAPLKAGLASVIAIATAVPAVAQQYRPTQEYQRDMRQYEAQQAQYEDSRAGYESARSDYERRRADWERARADYDRRYGPGSYMRAYGPQPTWDDRRWARYSNSSNGAYGDNGGYANNNRYANNNGYGANGACRPSGNNNNNTAIGGIIGAIAGAALGSNVAANGRGTEGTVLGAVVGGAIGAGVGNATNNRDRFQCDSRGPYFTYEDTAPYRESSYDRRQRSGRYDYAYYNRQRCRLAPAPIDSNGQDYRYVRVCPDREGRYRITG